MTKQNLIPVKQIAVYLTEQDHKDLKRSAIDRDTSVSAIIQEIVGEYLRLHNTVSGK